MSPRNALPLRHEYALLGFIRRNPAHGYELLQRWNDAGGISLVWRLKAGLLYSALEKLEQLGFIRCKMMAGDAAPERKQYRITPAGEKVLDAWIKATVSSAREFRQDFLVKLFFLQDFPAVSASSLLTRQRTVCRKWLESLTAQRDSSQGYENIIFRYRIYQVQGIIQWLEELSNSRADLLEEMKK